MCTRILPSLMNENDNGAFDAEVAGRHLGRDSREILQAPTSASPFAYNNPQQACILLAQTPRIAPGASPVSERYEPLYTMPDMHHNRTTSKEQE